MGLRRITRRCWHRRRSSPPCSRFSSVGARAVAVACAAHHTRGPTLGGRDDWRAFGILSGATISRSIVFYGLNTFLALYFMSRWHQTAAEGNQALAVFLGTSIFGTLLGGWLADRFGRRRVIQIGFVGALVFLVLFTQTSDRNLALALLVPLALFIFLPTSVLVVLGQEYLPRRVGMASGVTLGLAVSVGGMSASAFGPPGRAVRPQAASCFCSLAFLLVAAGQAFALPPVAGSDPIATEPQPETVAADRSEPVDRLRSAQPRCATRRIRLR